ncbi:hypothetical protein TNCV_3716971 [Trichonephila clavipes]|nr:hypothetical protein TNCV_3716971 [Trichonephila clavipes]
MTGVTEIIRVQILMVTDLCCQRDRKWKCVLSFSKNVNWRLSEGQNPRTMDPKQGNMTTRQKGSPCREAVTGLFRYRYSTPRPVSR